MLQQAKAVDERVGIQPQESRASKRARVKESKPDGKEKKEKRKSEVIDEQEAKRPKLPDATAEVPPITQDVPAPAALSV